MRTMLILLSLSLSFSLPAATLKIATLLPDGTRWMQLMREGAKVTAERTDGRVRLRFYPGGVMGNDNSVLRKIRVGQLQGGVLTAGGLATIYPDIQSYSLPFIFRSYGEVDHVREKMDRLLIEGLKKNEFVSFGLSEGGFVYLMSQHPITRVEQLRLHKVWSPEGDLISERAFQALGVTPIPLPLTDVLTGLQTGLIDTIGTSPAAAIALQWHTRINYLTDMPALYLYGSLVLKESALKNISPKDRRILEEVMGDTIIRINKSTRKDNESARQALENQGIEILTPNSEELARWLTLVGEAMKEMSKTEMFYSPALLEQINRLVVEHRKATK